MSALSCSLDLYHAYEFDTFNMAHDLTGMYVAAVTYINYYSKTRSMHVQRLQHNGCWTHTCAQGMRHALRTPATLEPCSRWHTSAGQSKAWQTYVYQNMEPYACTSQEDGRYGLELGVPPALWINNPRKAMFEEIISTQCNCHCGDEINTCQWPPQSSHKACISGLPHGTMTCSPSAQGCAWLPRSWPSQSLQSWPRLHCGPARHCWACS